MPFPPRDLPALAIATSFAAGLNVYATIATLGLLSRYHVVDLPPSLVLLGDGWVIGVSLALFLIEFVADKVPFFDLIWNALQTFVRVPVAALVAYEATRQLSPVEQLLTSVLAAAIALVAHGSKTAARVAVTPSPEPFSNMALSFGEDVIAVGLTWFATEHPLIAAGVVAVAVLTILLLVRVVVRAIGRLVRNPARAASVPPRVASG